MWKVHINSTFFSESVYYKKYMIDLPRPSGFANYTLSYKTCTGEMCVRNNKGPIGDVIPITCTL